VVLLEQISSQLAGFSNNTPPSSPGTAATAPFSPGLAILWVNVLWFLSLVTSIASAFYVMLVQQWVRRYTRMTQDLPREHVCIRLSLFLGAHKYRLSHAIGWTKVPLHISMLLFLSGLVIFLFTISLTIAIVVAIFTGLLGLAYFTLTILPVIDELCPYFTPMSDMSWYVWHAYAALAVLYWRWVAKLLHDIVVPHNLGDIRTSRQGTPPGQSTPPGQGIPSRQRRLSKWLGTLERSLWRHQQSLKDGLQSSIVQRALRSPVSMDTNMLTWLLQRPRMSESGMIREFLTNIPPITLVQLMCAPQKLGQVDLRRRLSDLLGSCAPGTVGLNLDEDERCRRLQACLNTVDVVVKAHFVTDGVSPSPSLLNEIWAEFANMRLMRALWVDRDLGIRLTARSICALFAKYLLNKSQHQESELLWLEGALGVPSHAVINVAFGSPQLRQVLNAKSFINGVLPHQTDVLPAEHLGSFSGTLQIIMTTKVQTHLSRNRLKRHLSTLVRQIQDDPDEANGDVVNKLYAMFPGYIPSPGLAPALTVPIPSSSGPSRASLAGTSSQV